MRPAAKIVLGAAAVASLTWLGWMPVRGAYVVRKADLTQSISTLASQVDRYRSAARDHVRVQDELRAYADRTLGGDLETVDHRLRSRLNRLGEDVGIEALTVGTGRVRRVESPARSQFSRRGQRALREELDFVEVEAWISGQGPLDRALELVARVEAESWLKHVTQVRLEPKENGKRFAVSLRLVTLFLPGREPSVVPPPADVSAGLDRYASLLARNPFRVPPAAPAAARKAAPRKPGARFAPWVLTGVASGPGVVVEVWLLNQKTGASRRLVVGESLHGLVLVGAVGETAEFRVAGGTAARNGQAPIVRVSVGGSLGDMLQ